jgi:predicted peroxiredoxin
MKDVFNLFYFPKKKESRIRLKAMPDAERCMRCAKANGVRLLIG